MVKKIITSAWPYVNATPHLGNLIGSVLSADVFARFSRLKGHEVVFVSGSDEHGTPVAVSAMDQKLTPEELTKINHAKIKELFERWLISYDNYTHTHNPVHIKFTQDFYTQVFKNGFVFTQEEDAFYCPNDKLFLPDRFVEGICPHCGSDYARGDQCDKCGKLLSPLDLKTPHCKICKKVPIVQKTKHWYMDFPKVQAQISAFVEKNPHLPDNARISSLNSIKEGLPSRAITRDLSWGIPATFPGSEGKSIYVWFEAVLGYLSAVKEWAENIKKDPSKFAYFWNDPQTQTVYFIGKDNIIFHVIIFPGLLLAYNTNLPAKDQFVLPYNVSSTEFLNYENEKFSKSRGIGVWIDEALELAPVEYWRYTLLRNRPEKSDTSFTWASFEHDILELNDIIGNFIHRTMSFIEKQYNAHVPAAPQDADLDDEDKRIIGIIKGAAQKIEALLEEFKLKEALNEIVAIARDGNVYINNKTPWKLFKTDKIKAGYTFYIAIQLVRTLAILLSPYIPNISDQIFHAIGSKESLNNPIWDSASELKVPADQVIAPAKPFFSKLDVKDLQAKLETKHGIKSGGSNENPAPSGKAQIDYTIFEQFQFKVGTIVDAEPVSGTKLIKLLVDIGEGEPRTIVGGIGEFYKADDLIGTQITIIANLEPKEIHGIMSNGMLLAADAKKKGLALIRPDKSVPNGSKVR